MSYGITSINSSGFTQIDENSESFLVIQTGTKPVNQAYVTLSNTLPDDILVFGRPSGGGTSGVKYLGGYVSDFTVSGTRHLRIYMTFNVARAINLTASSGQFDAAWYQGTAGSIDTAYVMLGPYATYQYEQYAQMGENFFKYTHRKAKFDYTNHTMGTTATFSNGDLQRGSSVYIRTGAGQRTEILGYIV